MNAIYSLFFIFVIFTYCLFFYMRNILGLKLTHPRLNFTHLNEHKFQKNFKDTSNPLCSCGFEPETTDHYLLRYKPYRSEIKRCINQSSKNFLKNS